MTEESKTYTYTQAPTTMSADIGKLAEALNKAQGQIKGAVKDNTNPFFKQSYADLSSVWDACREGLNKNGLAVTQTMAGTAEVTEVVTTLMHTSGQWINGKLAIKPVKVDPQAVGSAITYARRYALAAIVGVCPSDDDANLASGKQDARTVPTQKTTHQPTQKPVGVKTEHTEKPIPTEAPPPPPPQVSNDPLEAKSEGTTEGLLQKVNSKDGTAQNGKKYTKFGIQVIDTEGWGEWFNTFDKKLAGQAEEMTGRMVEVGWKQTKFGKDFVDIFLGAPTEGDNEPDPSDPDKEQRVPDEDRYLPF